MPITSSAKKALRASKKKRVFNQRRKDALVDVVKKVKKFVADKNTQEAMSLLSQAYKAIDKAAKTNLIKKNTASRKKSRLAKLVKKASAK
ncbi:MAG: ribosomal protein small subunit ribosomal protein [Candidatus Paceibacter sp.]|jgi:small subunit ribosomal protein S20|nr:ribosomal protein small subunit ribosomal protein [Candidatus Paceibacter sp.]